jgi:hypothetical protein
MGFVDSKFIFIDFGTAKINGKTFVKDLDFYHKGCNLIYDENYKRYYYDDADAVVKYLSYYFGQVFKNSKYYEKISSLKGVLKVYRND